MLVWQAPTRAMNPSIPEAFVAEAYERDPASAAAEYGAEFRDDITGFVTRQAATAVVDAGVTIRPAMYGTHYHAFADPSGGSADSMTLAIAHTEGGKAVLDCIREVRPPFSPEQVVYEFSLLLRTYNVRSVRGDRYGAEWVAETFRRHGISYHGSPKTRSEIYLELLPALNSGALRLLDDERLLTQLCSLERRTSRAGRDMVDHGPGGHDDVANAAAGALVAASPIAAERGRVLVGAY